MSVCITVSELCPAASSSHVRHSSLPTPARPLSPLLTKAPAAGQRACPASKAALSQHVILSNRPEPTRRHVRRLSSCVPTMVAGSARLFVWRPQAGPQDERACRARAKTAPGACLARGVRISEREARIPLADHFQTCCGAYEIRDFQILSKRLSS